MMTNKQKRARAIRYRQEVLNRKYVPLIVLNLIIVFAIMMIALMVGASGNNQNEGDYQTTYESKDHVAVTSPANTPSETTTEDVKETPSFCRNLSEDEKLMLAKIAMAEAEGESLETKIYVIMTVLNRVYSEDRYFPDTIEEVIFQNNNGTYQFSPTIPGGRYWTTEPNAECWEAVEIVNANRYDVSQGALYFESCADADNWHSRNLEFLFESDGMRFYK